MTARAEPIGPMLLQLERTLGDAPWESSASLLPEIRSEFPSRRSGPVEPMKGHGVLLWQDRDAQGAGISKQALVPFCLLRPLRLH